MAVSFNSYYLYKKYEKRGDQPWLPVYPETLSIDGDGTMPKVLKTSGDPACQPIYRLVETEDTICVEVFDKKYKLTLQDSSVVSAECDSTNIITFEEVASQYSGTLVSAEIGDCVAEIGDWAFAYCFSLISLTMPNSITSISDNAFYFCTGLTSVTIPDSVTSIGDYAFETCSGLTSITCLATTPPTINENSFRDTNNCPIYVPCASVDTYKAASGWSTYASRIKGIPPCAQPTFNGKFKLILNDSSTVSAECDATSAVTSGEVATQYSGTVVSAEIGDCVKKIGYGAFIGCDVLTSVTISDNVKSISGFAFGSCTSLVTCNMGTGVTKMGSSVFQICRSLTGITIPNGVTSIEMWTFYQCYSLTSITIPNSVATIAQAAFSNCTGLTGNLLIPDSVTSISDSAFSWCKGLSAATIGSGITTIGRYAFLGCSSLASITINATTPPALGEDPFSSTNNCPIYVPSGSVNTYKSAEGWSTYTSRIQAII